MIFCPSDSIYLKANTRRHGPLSNPKSAVVVVLAGMTCMMLIPCILAQDKAETRLNRKQY